MKLHLLLVAVPLALLGTFPAHLQAEPIPFPQATPEAVGLESEALQELVATVQEFVDEDKIVGAELVVIKDRFVVLHEAIGWRDREAGTPMIPDTLFNIRSMTKPVLGTVVQMLIDEGALKLDDRVGDYLPAFDDEGSGDITVEQLLTHRSGLPLTLLASWGSIQSLQDIAAQAGEHGPEREPGSAFVYSDTGTDVLGALVERVTGQPLDEVYRDRILDPLGMDDTSHLFDDDPLRARAASAYLGTQGDWNRYWSPTDEPFYPFAMGSQSLYATPVDYARFLTLWLDGGRLGDRTLLSPAAVERALAPVSDAGQPTGFADLDLSYGQMWLVYGRPGQPPELFGHSGSDGTWAWAWPDADLMVLYFTQSRGQASGIGLEAVIDRLLLHPERYPEATDIPAGYEAYLGTFTAPTGRLRNRPFEVLLHNGRLALNLPEQLVVELLPDEEGSSWRFSIDPAVVVTFEHDPDGSVSALILHQSGESYTVPRGFPQVEEALDPESVERYLGTYRDEEAGRDLEVLIHNEHLAIRQPETPVPLELYPPDTEGWWALRLDPSLEIRFDEDEEGRIVSFTVRSPDGVGVRVRVDLE